MAQFNANDARYQREIQNAAAKRSMGPSRLARADSGDISAKHAGYQLGRQQQFRRLALSSQLAKNAHELNLARTRHSGRSMDLRAQNIADQNEGLMWTVGSGLLTSGLGIMEGRRRAAVLAKDRDLEEAKLLELRIANDRARTQGSAMQSRLRGNTGEGALMSARSLGRF